MIYLASPYAHTDPAVMQKRYEMAVQFVNDQYKVNIPIYSPIVHNHPVALLGGLPRTWDYWKMIDLAMLRLCHALWVLQLPGWDKSVGVTAEIKFAEEVGMLIRYIPTIVNDELTV
jgi:hypothetical protein